MSLHQSHVMHVHDNNDYPEAGWYFSDEAQQLHGPYATEVAAYSAFLAYAAAL